ncbi:ATP-binding cassette domain-containing protein [Streptococcus marmotae]|uniref:ATP-binding cassette domain-containing protein n=1 Tax=Streptococcus marmotae TaxID=1825069 RepID=UPI0008312023|nr:ABC transporter ATP-binding protein [Streptococcus marmotae]
MKNKYFWLTLLCIFMVSLLNIGFLYQYRGVIDTLSQQQLNLFLERIFLMVLTVVVMLFFEYSRQLLNIIYLNQIGFRIHATLLGNIFTKDYDDYTKHVSGHYMSEVNNDIERVKENYYDSLFTIFQGVCSFVLASFALLSLDFLTASFVIITSFLPVIIPYLYRNRSRHLQNTVSDTQAIYNTRLSDILEGYLNVKNATYYPAVMRELERRYSMINRAVQQSAWTTTTMRIVVGLIFYATTILIILIGGFQVFSGVLTLGGLTAILTISEQLVDPINSIANAFLDLHAVKDIQQRLQPARDDEIAFALDEVKENQEFNTLEFQNLTYQNAEHVLFQSVNYRFEKGKKYLITGKSGCGKSTLALLLTKNIPIQTGTIFLNDTSFATLSYRFIQDKIAYISQKSHLFQDSVRYNLTLGASVSDNKLLELLAVVGLRERFPDSDSLEEMISDESSLSGGQRQRLLLIRSLLEEKEVLLLDESLSALDSAMFQQIEEYLTGIPYITLIHISHRLSEHVNAYYDEVIDLDMIQPT